MTKKRKITKSKGPRKAQLSMLEEAPKAFGGSLLKGHAKCKRPLSTKNPVHLVLKSRHGFGRTSMLHPAHVKSVDRCVRKQARRNGIRLYHFVNAGNHIHLVVKLHNRDCFQAFIRAITGLIARQVTGRERGAAMIGKKIGDRPPNPATLFWIQRPFTRVANWGRDYRNLGRYMAQNQAQVERHGLDIARRLGARVDGFDHSPHQRPYQNSA